MWEDAAFSSAVWPEDAYIFLLRNFFSPSKLPNHFPLGSVVEFSAFKTDERVLGRLAQI